MQKRHENALNDLLEQVAYEGYGVVKKWKLSRWYGQERFSVGIRRDVNERWSDLASEWEWEHDKELKFVDVDGKIILMHKCEFFDDHK